MVWQLFRELDRLRDDFNRRLGYGSEWGPVYRGEAPPVNIFETPEEYIVTVEAPGADRETFEVSFTAGSLSVRGQYKQPEVKGELIRSEMPTGSFSRIVRLPEQVDPNGIHADYKDGVLTVRAAKTPEAKPKRIKVKVS